MKYLPSLLGIGQLSGSGGSVTASHNRFGTYFRNRTVPVNPNSPTQQAVRNILRAASQNWRTLTDSQRAGWEAAAALIPKVDSLGRTYFQTGSQFYVSTQLAVKGYLATAAFGVDATLVVTPANLVSVTPAPAAGLATFTVAYTATPLAALTKVVISASAQFGAGISYVGRSKLKTVFTSTAAAASPADIHAAYIALFGALLAGQRIYVRAQVLSSTGGRSQLNDQIVSVAV